MYAPGMIALIVCHSRSLGEKIIMKMIKSPKTWQLIFIWQVKKWMVEWQEKLEGRPTDRNDWQRPMIQFIAENYPHAEKYYHNNLIGVEIGVAGGGNAYSIMNLLPMKKLYLIDPFSWSSYEVDGYTEASQPAFTRVRDIAVKLLKPFGDRVEFIEKFSEDASGDIPDNLDFIYVDGNHEYDYVMRDLEMYYPKVKTGGVFGGDNFESLLPDVARAVLDFTLEKGLKIHGGRSEASYEWWVIKPFINEDINDKIGFSMYGLQDALKGK